MNFLKKITSLICVGAVYNLYFLLLQSDSIVWLNFLYFVVFGYIDIFILEQLFKRSLTFQKNIYFQIIMIFLLSSLFEIIYMTVTGLSLWSSLQLVLLGIPITVGGIIYWKYRVTRISKLLNSKKIRLSE